MLRENIVLKKKFPILNCISLHDLEDIIVVAETCIIIHNMMVEERMKSGFVESDKFYEDERVLMNGDEDRIQSNEDNYLIQEIGMEMSSHGVGILM